MFLSVLISTFNGEQFLAETLESLEVAQNKSGFRLFFRDDGSTDATKKILLKFARQFPTRIRILEDAGSQLGPSTSFSRLIEASDSPYLMLCDQDDVWLPDKIEKTMAAMREAEKQYGSNTPLLVHTDLKVVDADLQLIADSFWNYQNLFPEHASQLNRLLAQNVVTGCTVMMNRPLADLATPIPVEAVMHDWWLALVAATFGKVVYLDEQTILYRQHGTNSVGAKRWGIKRILHQANSSTAVRESMLKTMRQAQVLLDRYKNKMSTEQVMIVEAYARLPYMPRLDRIWALFRYRFFKHGIVRNIGFLTNLLLLKKIKCE